MVNLKSFAGLNYDNERLYCHWGRNVIYDELSDMAATTCEDADEKVKMGAIEEFRKRIISGVKMKMEDEITFSEFKSKYDFANSTDKKVSALFSVHTANVLYNNTVLDEISLQIYFNRIPNTKRFCLNDLVIRGGKDRRIFRRYIRITGAFDWEGRINSYSGNMKFSNYLARKIEDLIRYKKKEKRNLIKKIENDRLDKIMLKKFINEVF